MPHPFRILQAVLQLLKLSGSPAVHAKAVTKLCHFLQAMPAPLELDALCGLQCIAGQLIKYSPVHASGCGQADGNGKACQGAAELLLTVLSASAIKLQVGSFYAFEFAYSILFNVHCADTLSLHLSYCFREVGSAFWVKCWVADFENLCP